MATLEASYVIYDTLVAKYGDAKLRIIVCKMWHRHTMKNRTGTGAEYEKSLEINRAAKQAEQDAITSMRSLEAEIAKVMYEIADQYIADPIALEQYLSR